MVIVFGGWLTLALLFPYSYGHPGLGASGENIEGFLRALQFWGVPALVSSAGIIINLSVGQELIVRIGIWGESEQRRNQLNRIGKSSIMFSVAALLGWTTLLVTFHSVLIHLPFVIILVFQCLIMSLTLAIVFYVNERLAN
jgi:hypothetical protein